MNNSSDKLGVIENVGTETAKVDLANGEGIISVTWTLLCKHIIIGDFVEVLSGPFRELTGWVDDVDGETVHVIQNTSLNPLRENQHDRIKVNYMLAPTALTNFLQKFEIHVNWLNVMTPEVLHVPLPSNPDNEGLSSAWSNQVPWLGQAVLVSKANHPFKGCQAIVKGVLYGQDTLSGLQIVAQLSYWDPTVPYHTIVLDYNDVVGVEYV